MKKTGVSVFIPVLLLIFFGTHTAVFGAENTSLPEWTLAACAFNVEDFYPGYTAAADQSGQTAAFGESGEKIAELLPRLILERAADAGTRMVLPEELYERRKKELLKERRSLYENLEKAVYERDKLIASDLSERKLYESIAAKEKDAEKLRSELKKNQESSALLAVSDFKSRYEYIVLWKKNAAELYAAPFAPPADSSNKKADSLVVRKREPEDINALISGSVTRSGTYIKADVSLVLYPGGNEVLKVSETSAIDRLDTLASSLASQLEFALQNTKKVRLFFDIQPVEAAGKISVRLDGRLLPLNKDEGSLSADIRGGIHDLYVEAEGYKGASFVYDFSSADEFYISVHPEKQNDIPLKISSSVLANSRLFFNGLAVFPSSDTEDENSAVFTVNGLPVLAELQLENGIKKSFLLTQRQGKFFGMNEYSLPVKQKAGASGIEKKRKIMYNSYAALIVSLPVTFSLFGKHIDEYNSWARGNNVRDDLDKWQIAYYTAAGISAGLGINFLVQLGLYLHAANSVLPEKVIPKKNTK